MLQLNVEVYPSGGIPQGCLEPFIGRAHIIWTHGSHGVIDRREKHVCYIERFFFNFQNACRRLRSSNTIEYDKMKMVS